MDQTPAHDQHNPDLLRLMPSDARCVIEVGCSSGALAREYKKQNNRSKYIGIEIDPDYAKRAERFCDEVRYLDVEVADESFFDDASSCECWVFGDTLEHMRDPWRLLKRIRYVIPSNGSIVACIPNAQHWSVQAKLSCGEFRYERSGLFDRTHLRWFTRLTIIEMFQTAGFRIESAIPRIFYEPNREKFLPLISAMAATVGADANIAVNDAMPLQYVIKAVPASIENAK